MADLRCKEKRGSLIWVLMQILAGFGVESGLLRGHVTSCHLQGNQAVLVGGREIGVETQ